MGKFKIFKFNQDEGCLDVVNNDNTLTTAGRRWVLDRMFDSGSHGWNEVRAGFLGIGTSTDADGVTGPTPWVSVAKGGDWNGPASTDWKLAHFVTMGTGHFTRTGELVTITANFNNSSFATEWATYGTGSVPICEEGLFLGSTEPAANPLNNTTYEDRAMIARGSIYKTINSGSSYLADPIWKANDGNDIGIAYDYSLAA
jgi:hypothetical protein